MKLSIIMPAYNEVKTIKQIIHKVLNVKLPIDKELIVVDDGSTDKTRDILKKEFSNHKKIKLIFQKANSGKGFAIRTGLKHVSGDIVIIQDADLELDPSDFPKLISPIISKKTKVVYGSRFLGKKHHDQAKSFYLGSQGLTFLANILYNIKITDEATCYKVFDTKVIKSIPLRCKRFEFCPEITAKVAKRGYKIIEVPVSYKPRKITEGKKIRLSDGLDAAWTLIKYRFYD